MSEKYAVFLHSLSDQWHNTGTIKDPEQGASEGYSLAIDAEGNEFRYTEVRLFDINEEPRRTSKSGDATISAEGLLTDFTILGEQFKSVLTSEPTQEQTVTEPSVLDSETRILPRAFDR